LEQLFPNFIQAESLIALRSLMADTSIRRGGTVTFFSVYYDPSSKKHVAWFHDKLENISADIYKNASIKK
jgi:hypothetical protein